MLARPLSRRRVFVALQGLRANDRRIRHEIHEVRRLIHRRRVEPPPAMDRLLPITESFKIEIRPHKIRTLIELHLQLGRGRGDKMNG